MVFFSKIFIMQPEKESFNQQIVLPFTTSVSLTVKREDVLHSQISGNKFRKLKYNLLEAKAKGVTKLMTFGGAYSNHIAAVAAAGKLYGFETVGIIRGEEIKDKFLDNETLKLAHENGMQFEFITRSDYRTKTDVYFLENLKRKFGNFYLIPEGGTNELAVKGCEEILTKADANFNYLCSAVGTGGTISGIINSAHENQKILGFPALKENYLQEQINLFSKNKNSKTKENGRKTGENPSNRTDSRQKGGRYEQDFVPDPPVCGGL